MSCVSFAHNVSSKGHYLAMVSTTVETSNPEGELKPGLDLLGPILQKLVIFPGKNLPNRGGGFYLGL